MQGLRRSFIRAKKKQLFHHLKNHSRGAAQQRAQTTQQKTTTMKNTTTKQLKAMSQNTLEERLEALFGIIQTLETYCHVFATNEKLHIMAQTEIHDILNELKSREQ